MLSRSARADEVEALARGITSLVGDQLDDLGFVNDLRAIVTVLSGARVADVARAHGISRKRLEVLAAAAEVGGRGAVVKVRNDPRPAFNMIRTLFIGRVTEGVFRLRYQNRIEQLGLTWH